MTESMITFEHFMAMYYSNYELPPSSESLQQYADLYKMMEERPIVEQLIAQLESIEQMESNEEINEILKEYGIAFEEFKALIAGVVAELRK
ncbi:hypothetical protein AV654_17045 [Paenibacillus elgii]|uniref:Uncharacterized protein n=1 Tax=Paenibacillus elgii TaxID=189691 RepID=A0A161S3U3_9BACL|nr:hypothetical protein [Paenibacillus elgii]KZE79184.1 hypothetical protein AV654_17045 [Paenibacillus elgii]